MLEINPVFGSFAIIATLTLLQCTTMCTLVGEDTPVWTARCTHSKGCVNMPVKYERLNKSIIRETLKYWKSDEFKQMSFRTGKNRRSIEGYLDNEDESYDFYESEKTENELESLAGNVRRTKRRNGRVTLVSALVMVDYDASKVKDEASQRRFVMEKILYTLAYWNCFNIRVWDVDRKILSIPRISVKLVGIIIGLNRGATPYIRTSDTPSICVKDSNMYWNSSPNETEFPRNSYHAVATMTDVRPTGHYGGFDVLDDSGGRMPSVLVWDNQNFWNLWTHNQLVYRLAENYLRSWAHTSPKTYSHMTPGNEVQSILPGMLMSPEEQCKVRGWTNLQRTCPERSTNCMLYCLNKGILRYCQTIGVALPGTPCKDGVVG